MKKIFIFLLSAAIALVACTKLEDTAADSYIDNQIAFNANGGVATKAIVDGTAMIDRFGVYGYVVPGTYSTNGGYLMKNAEYDKDGNAVGGPYYWPKSDNNLGIDFIFTAYSQFDNGVTWEKDTVKVNVPILTQTLINNPDGFDDVLWAQTPYNHHQDGNIGATHERVNLTFKHALSWLQFRGEVTNPNIKWVKVKQISFGSYRDSVAAVAPVPEVPAYDDTTDTWVNLKNNGNVIATSTQTKAPGATSYVNAQALPEDLVAEIKSYYSVDSCAAGAYELKLGKSAWDPVNNTTATIKKLRVVKDIPAEYKMTVDMHGEGIEMDFFDAIKYLNDNGYYVQSGVSGGKPQVFSNNYVILDAYVNGAAYTIVGLDWGYSTSVPQYTIVHHDMVPGVPGKDAVPAHGTEGIFVDGSISLPTASLITTDPVAVCGTKKDTTLNYVSSQVDTLFTNDQVVLGNALVIPQNVPESITIVFDICISNTGGDAVVFTDRKITRTINTGNDMKNLAYVASWAASNKYIYNFKFEGDIVDFNTSVAGWSTTDYNYHVWDYTD